MGARAQPGRGQRRACPGACHPPDSRAVRLYEADACRKRSCPGQPHARDARRPKVPRHDRRLARAGAAGDRGRKGRHRGRKDGRRRRCTGVRSDLQDEADEGPPRDLGGRVRRGRRVGTDYRDGRVPGRLCVRLARRRHIRRDTRRHRRRRGRRDRLCVRRRERRVRQPRGPERGRRPDRRHHRCARRARRRIVRGATRPGGRPRRGARPLLGARAQPGRGQCRACRRPRDPSGRRAVRCHEADARIDRSRTRQAHGRHPRGPGRARIDGRLARRGAAGDRGRKGRRRGCKDRSSRRCTGVRPRLQDEADEGPPRDLGGRVRRGRRVGTDYRDGRVPGRLCVRLARRRHIRRDTRRHRRRRGRRDRLCVRRRERRVRQPCRPERGRRPDRRHHRQDRRADRSRRL